MNDLKPYISYLKENRIPEPDGKKLISEDKNLTQDEKLIIYRYLYPRQLLDRELPSRVQNTRSSFGIPQEGLLEPDLHEYTNIIEASQTEQYKRFMKHLFYAFCDYSKIAPISGSERFECPICGKILYGQDIWLEGCKTQPTEKDRQEYLAFGSKESSITLCKDCLLQLFTAKDILDKIDPEFLGGHKGNDPNPWDNLKLIK